MNTPEPVMQEALHAFDRDISDLRVSNAQLSTSVDNLVDKVNELSKTVASMNDTMNKGKGALWLIVLFAGSLGAAITTLIKKLAGVV